jgi:hypothetical protein
MSDLFEAAIAKRLSLVEVSRSASNQHEFNGTKALQSIFGESVKGTAERQKHMARFVYLADEDLEPIFESAEVTWYDARAKTSHRTGRAELRLYFKDNGVMRQAEEGDILLIAKHPNDELFFFVVASGAPIASVLTAFLGLEENKHAFALADAAVLPLLQQLFSVLTDLLGAEAVSEEFQKVYAQLLEQRFGQKLPNTKVFSDFARQTCPIPPIDADERLVAFMQHEERLFRLIENRLFAGVKATGFADVDEFINQALTFINRRKSRVGASLELHLAVILEENFVRFSEQSFTEGKEKPDFIFPSIDNYHDLGFPTSRLTMLAAKYSCKERWRQILGEAARIPTKHLITFERGISAPQTDAMQQARVQLVIPQPLFITYTAAQQDNLMNLGEFIELVKTRQTNPI